MKQMTFADAEYAGKRKQTRKELFLIEMDRVVPWKGLIALIEPHYPKGEGGRPAYPLMAMLRVHLLQNWFGYSDPAMEEALYETTILRQFAGLNLERIPDETTILNFRRLLEKHELAAGILAVINGYLGDRGLSLAQDKTRIVHMDEGFDFLGFRNFATFDITDSGGDHQGFAMAPGAIGWAVASTLGVKVEDPDRALFVPEFGLVCEQKTDGNVATGQWDANAYFGVATADPSIAPQTRIISIND